MADYQVKMTSTKNLNFNVYFCPAEDCFRLKVAFKMLNFEVSLFVKKNNVDLDMKDGFVIQS